MMNQIWKIKSFIFGSTLLLVIYLSEMTGKNVRKIPKMLNCINSWEKIISLFLWWYSLSTLIGSKQNWTLLHQLSTTEYLNYEKTKFSKSNEVGVFGNHVESTGIPSEVWRYYFLANLPKKSDTDFKGMASSLEIIMNYRKLGNLVKEY